MIKEITSKENPVFKNTRKLLKKSAREEAGLFLAEGVRLCTDAVAAGRVEYLFLREDTAFDAGGCPCYRLPSKLFDCLTSVETPQGVLAVCTMEQPANSPSGYPFLVALDGVADPGNVGTILRTAECAGAGAVLALPGTADPYSPKAVRSTMGSIFRLPIFIGGYDLLSGLTGYDIAAAALDGSENLYRTEFAPNLAVVVGSEARGVSREVLAMSNKKIRIPMLGGAESLNASVAAGIILYEVLRREL